MAKNLTTFFPGAQTASSSLTYKEHRYYADWGQGLAGCSGPGEYGNDHHYLDRDDTPCTEDNNRHVMRRTTGKQYGTEVFAITSSGAAGGACCCQQSSPGKSGLTFKFSPRWSTDCNDSDTMRMCIPMTSGCCHPNCVGCCGLPFRFCVGGGTGPITGTHPITSKGNSGQPGNFCLQALGGCGAASVCNYYYQPCCNYGALTSSGGWRHPCCCIWDTGLASCYTNDGRQEPGSDCDRGYDCCACIWRIGGNFEVGTCINRENSGMCGTAMMSGSSISKSQIFRQGVQTVHAHTICEMQMGGWHHKCNRACLWGNNPQQSAYWIAGMGTSTASTCGGPCCCGGPGTGGVVRVIYDDGNPNP